jgi:hypothetical protein
MCRVILILLFMSLMAVLTGCTAVREGAVAISEADLKNVETGRIIARNYLEAWPFQSAFIKGALGARMDELPSYVVDAMEELDQISIEYGTMEPNDVNDTYLGKSLGLRVQMLTSIIAEALKFYMPDALDFVPFLF